MPAAPRPGPRGGGRRARGRRVCRSRCQAVGQVAALDSSPPSQKRASSLSAEERAPQGPRQRDGVERVLDDREHVDQVVDLLLRVEGRPADDVVIEPLGRRAPSRRARGRSSSGTGTRRRPGGPGGRSRPCVAVADRPAGVEPRRGSGGRASAPRPCADRRRRPASSASVPSGSSAQTNSTAGPSLGGLGDSGRAQPRALAREGVGEEGVDEVEHARRAPEVLGQVEPALGGEGARGTPGRSPAGPLGSGRSTA